MKCPKCGFVSYAGLEQCKKCGYPFVKAASKGSSSLLTSSIPEGEQSVSRPPSEPLPETREDPPSAEPELPTQQISPPTPPPAQVSSAKEDPPAADRPRMDEQPQDWREELSERVETFHKRRARLQPDAGSTENLELDFENDGKPEGHRFLEDTLAAPEDMNSGFDLELGESPVIRGEDDALPATLSFEEPTDEMMQLDAASAKAVEMSLGESHPKSPPMEILVGSPTETPLEEGDSTEGIFLAPLGRRILAGLTDAFVLFLGSAVFGIIFWRVCGRLSPVPLNIAVFGLVAVILIFAYFAVFTAVASATPGLLWMGCEIRNLNGGRPTVSEAFWRAFGVLVSLSALMLGFVWACVDSDNLTWHDRMSGTVITEERNAADLAHLKAQI